MNALTQAGRPVAIVTGAAQGIGRAIAQRLAGDGFRVVVADLRGSLAAAREIDADGWGTDMDVSNAVQVDDMVAQTLQRYGRIDALVNNAGLYTSLGKRPFDEIPPDEWRRVFEVNVEGVWHCCRAVAPAMKAAGRGAIVNISSASVAKGNAHLLHYVASKGAVQAMTRVLARELGEWNIRVNTVSPGFTLSDGVLSHGTSRDKQREDVRQARVIHDDVQPDDIAGAVAFVVGERARMITGQTLMVDGGMVMN